MVFLGFSLGPVLICYGNKNIFFFSGCFLEMTKRICVSLFFPYHILVFPVPFPENACFLPLFCPSCPLFFTPNHQKPSLKPYKNHQTPYKNHQTPYKHHTKTTPKHIKTASFPQVSPLHALRLPTLRGRGLRGA